MVFHPPLLYMGYVGFSVAFSFAIAALLGGSLDATWARWSRPWTTVAWAFLTVGIALGSGWAYYDARLGRLVVLGPGRERLVHALAHRHRRSFIRWRSPRSAARFKSWTVLLAIVAFSLSLLGTFLVRSGVLTSVHAFATDPARGVFILAFLALVIGGSLALFAWRARQGRARRRASQLVSRESAAARQQRAAHRRAGERCCWARSIRCFSTRSDLGKISVGPPYFDAVFYPLMAPAIVPDGRRTARALDAHAPARARDRGSRWALAVAVVTALSAAVSCSDAGRCSWPSVSSSRCGSSTTHGGQSAPADRRLASPRLARGSSARELAFLLRR